MTWDLGFQQKLMTPGAWEQNGATYQFKSPGATTREQADNLLPHHCSYAYHGRGLTRATAGARVIASEAVSHHGIKDPGANVLFASARVEWVAAARVTEVLRDVATGPTTIPTTRDAKATTNR